MEKRDWEMALSVLNSLEISISENTPHNLIGIALAKEAVQKQMPKKVVDETHCSSCGVCVLNYEDRSYQIRHCHWCGQALDWSESEKEGVEE